MRMRSTLVLAPLLAACGAADSTGLLAEHHGPLRSPCTTTDVPLRSVLRLVCSAPPSSPEIGDTDLWRGPLPKSSLATHDDGKTDDVTYDYAEPYAYPNATYRDDGNLETVTFDGLVPDDPPVAHYTYDGDTLVGAFVMVGGERQGDTEIVYEGGRRKYEGLVGKPSARVEYAYDGNGEVLARIGAGARGQVPDLPAASMLAAACPTFMVPLASGADDDCSVTYYFRDGEGRPTTILHGVVPGFAVTRVDLTWDGDRLASAARTCSDSESPELGNLRVTYAY